MPSAFAAVVDWSRPPGDAPLDALVAAIAADGPARTLVTDGLALAWTGADDPVVDEHGRLTFVDGDVYAVAGATEDRVGTAEVATLHDRFGEALFPRLRADAAVVVHDPRHRRTTVVRDHLGGRSVVWHRSGSRVHLATEVNHLVPLLPSRPAPDPVAVAHWLSPSGPPGDRTMYEGVQRLPRGNLLVVDGAGATHRRYWTLTPTPRPERLSLDEAGDRLRDHLTRAIRRRSPGADVTAVLLSGGLDSSSVAALASTLEDERRPRRSYSATFPHHPSIDESELIDLTCETVGLTSTRVVVRSGSVVAGALPYIERWSLPPVSPNLFFWRPLFDRIRADGTDVLLDGEGGDETFGLAPFLLSDRLRQGRVRAAADLVRRVPGGGSHLGRETIVEWLRSYGAKGLVPHSIHQAVRRVRGADRYAVPWLRPELHRHVRDHDLHAAWKQHRGPRWWAYLLDAVATGAASALAYDHIRRRAAMSGLRSLHPLVDVDVVEFVLGLDPELAFDPRWSRPVFRQATAGLLPDPVRLRPSKSTFNAAFHEALVGPDLAVADALLRPGEARVEAYVDLGVARARLVDQVPPPDQRDMWSLHLWRLLTTELWLRGEDGSLDDDRWRRLLVAPSFELQP